MAVLLRSKMFIVCICLIVVILICGCASVVGNSAIAGKYVADNPKWYVELNADGTCYNSFGGDGAEGSYTIKGNNLRMCFGGIECREFTISGNTLIDANKWVFTKA